jgi:class 3 adenylate cyclase
VRYDIYGEDVIKANGMESNGAVGKIQVSETTKRLLEQNNPGRFKFERHSDVVGKGSAKSVTGYLVQEETLS